MAATDPQVTGLPTRTELWSLAGLSLFAAACVAITAAFASWGSNFELPLREFTFIGIALVVATLYALYRTLTANADLAGTTPPDRRLSLSGESVGLGVLVLCGLVTVLNFGARSSGTVASGTVTGDADAIGPRLRRRAASSRSRVRARSCRASLSQAITSTSARSSSAPPPRGNSFAWIA